MVKVFLLGGIFVLLKEDNGWVLLCVVMGMWLEVKREFKFGSGMDIDEFW